MRECVPEANGDLPGGPIALQVLGNPVPQPAPPGQQAWLRPASACPGPRIGIGCPIRVLAAITADLATDRRGSSTKAPGNLTHR